MCFKMQISLLLALAGVFVIAIILIFAYSWELFPEGQLPTLLLGNKVFGAILVALTLLFLALLSDLFFKIKAVYQEKNKGDVEEYMDYLYNDIRGKIHDYNNHLQVLYTLLIRGNHKDAREYVDELVEDAALEQEILKTNYPALDSLLYYKAGLAKAQGIETDIYIMTDLKDLEVKATELSRALGNIITNAIETLAAFGGEKELTIIIRQERGYHFEIINSGPTIPKAFIKDLFKPGFTTKDYGQGLGLYTARNIIEKYGGVLNVSSDNNETIFDIFFPEKEVDYVLEKSIYGGFSG